MLLLQRAKIVRGGHCTCRKDVHFRRRLLYCYEEIKTSQVDRSRIESDLRASISSSASATPKSADKRRLLREQTASRIAAVAEHARAAIGASTPRRKGEGIATQSKEHAMPTMGGTPGSPSPAQIGTPSRGREFSPGRGRQSLDRSFGSVSSAQRHSRHGVMHSMDGSLNLRRSMDGDAVDASLSHWDIAHVEAAPRSLEKYRDINL
jgi:hypothetical protein